jgi:hypothetical protein
MTAGKNIPPLEQLDGLAGHGLRKGVLVSKMHLAFSAMAS